jgi:hypothetical protein
VRCSGDAGATASVGDDSAPSSVGADTVLKSGLKLSPPAPGDIKLGAIGFAGGAAIAGTAATVAVDVGCR